MLKGKIHSFESFGTVDGPGIRFVVFMQGCPFKCLYCHNPDSWDALGGTEYTVAEVLEKAKRYKPYFEKSGGGITVSGGEPLMQVDFVTELFRRCKEEGIHTALDTNGYACGAKRDTLLEYTDLVLLDIKHMNNTVHRVLTGFSNDSTLGFAQHLDHKNIPIWLRYVVVPGLTDDEINIRKLKAFIDGLTNIEKIELLPFHKMGEYKWKELNLDYTLSDTLEATVEDMERIRKIVFSDSINIVE